MDISSLEQQKYQAAMSMFGFGCKCPSSIVLMYAL